MEIALPWNDNAANEIMSSDESSSSDDMSSIDDEVDTTPLIDIKQPPQEITSEGATIRKAEMYQYYMRKLPIPRHRGTVIPFSSWVGLGNSLKQLYGQPLHYLTNMLLQQWDKMRFDNGDDQDLDIVIHPCKAEASVWLVEEMHRLTASHHYIAKRWLSDSMHHVFVDSIFPELCSNRPESAAGDASV